MVLIFLKKGTESMVLKSGLGTMILSISILVLISGCGRSRHIPIITPGIRPIKTILIPKPKQGETTQAPYEVYGEKYYPLPDAEGYVETGKASWYGDKFHGRLTSNGEIYDMHKKTAAHKTLPFDTVVKVVNLADNSFTIVRINDRGPFVKGRSIDLSYAAAKEINLIGPGVADVKIIALAKEAPHPEEPNNSTTVVELPDFKEGEFTVQIGAFQNKDNAQKLVDRFKSQYEYADILPYTDQDNRTLFRVHISKSKTLAEAAQIEKTLEEMGFGGAFIVRI
jgi:rare lipoprotein A